MLLERERDLDPDESDEELDEDDESRRRPLAVLPLAIRPDWS